jgi:hypothetical protein
MKRRQDPVSCQLCRSKKLKCNRLQPCSNCKARGVTCEFSSSKTPEKDGSRVQIENETILARLKRLEDVVLTQENQLFPSNPRISSISARFQRAEDVSTEDEEAQNTDFKKLEDVGTEDITTVS